MTHFTKKLAPSGLVLVLALSACAPKPDPAALEQLRQQQAAEAAREKSVQSRQAADKAFEALDRDTR